MTSDVWKNILEGATLLGAAIAFMVGLVQYQRAQQWKRAEFLAQEMKELFSDLKCSNALTMIDWAERDIPLGAFQTPSDPARVVVDYAQQSKALRPHTLPPQGKSGDTSPGAPVAMTQSLPSRDGKGQFNSRETLIRDCYDGLLDRLDRIGSYISRGLISVDDVRPYIGYYVNDIAEVATTEDEALWGVSILTYIIFYHFEGVVALLAAFEKDIDPDKEIFAGFVRATAVEHRKRAEGLQDAARAEWKKMGDWVSGNPASRGKRIASLAAPTAWKTGVGG